MTGILLLASVLLLPSTLAVVNISNNLENNNEGKIGPQLQLHDPDAMLFHPSPVATEVNNSDSEDFLEVRIGPDLQLFNSDGNLFLPSFLAFGFDSKAAEDFIKRKLGTHSLLQNSDGNTTSISTNRKRRSIPRQSTCKFPTKYHDCFLNCKLYPNRVSCMQICPFGYTFPEGIMRIMTCRNDENRWEPRPDFEKCKPFIDGLITAGPGAKYKCITRYMRHGTICDISCAKHEDKPAVPKSKYQCDIQGNWKPKLPFCVQPKSGQILVPAPKGQQSLE